MNQCRDIITSAHVLELYLKKGQIHQIRKQALLIFAEDLDKSISSMLNELKIDSSMFENCNKSAMEVTLNE